MNVARYIGLFLLKNEQCYVHGLGTLQLLRKASSYDGQSLQPYWYEVTISAGGNVDESLANFIANNEQISISKASNSLSEFSTDTQTRLKAGENVELPQLGKFTWEDGRVAFITAPHLQHKAAPIAAQKGVSLKHNERAEGTGKKFVLPTAPVNTTYRSEQQQPIAPPMPQVRQYMQKPQPPKERLNWARILFVLILLPVLAALAYYGYMRYIAPKKATIQSESSLTPPETVEEIAPVVSDTVNITDSAMPDADTTISNINVSQPENAVVKQKPAESEIPLTTQTASKNNPASASNTPPPTQANNTKIRNLRVVIHTSDNKESAYSLKKAAESKGNKVEVLEEDVNYYFVVVNIKSANTNNNKIEDSVSKIYNVEQAFVY